MIGKLGAQEGIPWADEIEAFKVELHEPLFSTNEGNEGGEEDEGDETATKSSETQADMAVAS